MPLHIKSLWLSDAIWRHKSGSTLAQVMAWCTTPNHYMNQYWLIISMVLWHSPKSNFTASAQATILYSEFGAQRKMPLKCRPFFFRVSLCIMVGELTILSSPMSSAITLLTSGVWKYKEKQIPFYSSWNKQGKSEGFDSCDRPGILT